MLRILHLSYFPVSLKSPNQHAVSIKLSNGFTRNGHAVFNLSDRDVARGLGLGHRRFGRWGLNRMLPAFCREHRPDLIVLGHADMVDAGTISAIRAARPALRVVQWNVDPLFEPDNIARIRGKLGVVDATLITTAGAPLDQLRGQGGTIGFMPNPVDVSIERGRADLVAEPAVDVFYPCGNPARPPRLVCGREWNMEDFCTSLRALLPAGLRFSTFGMFGETIRRGAAYQEEMEKSAIGLNISRRPDYPLYSSDRLAHLAGNGVLPAIERATGYGRIFGEDEMLFFSSMEDLAENIARNIAEPARRMRVAGAGRARYIELFNERRVAAYVVDAAFHNINPASYPWPDTAT